MAKFWVSILLGSLLFFFQNCSQTKFSTNALGNEKGTLVEMEEQEEEQQQGIEEVVDPTQNQPNSPVVVGGNPNQPSPPRRNMPPAPRVPEVKEPEEVEEPEESPELVACILEGNGKSIKLGLIEQNLGGVHAVSRSVCVTRKGCLELAAKKFEVKEAVVRGYCRNNPNVVRLSDAELTELLK